MHLTLSSLCVHRAMPRPRLGPRCRVVAGSPGLRKVVGVRDMAASAPRSGEEVSEAVQAGGSALMEVLVSVHTHPVRSLMSPIPSTLAGVVGLRPTHLPTHVGRIWEPPLPHPRSSLGLCHQTVDTAPVALPPISPLLAPTSHSTWRDFPKLLHSCHLCMKSELFTWHSRLQILSPLSPPHPL